MSLIDDFLESTNRAYDECEAGITKLDRMIVGVPDGLSGATRLALVPAVYAYWERFFRVAVGDCYRIVNAEALRLSALSEPLAIEWLRHSYTRLYSEQKIARLSELPSRVGSSQSSAIVGELSAAHAAPISFDADLFVETESNVTYAVVVENLKRLGILPARVAEKTSRRGTLYQLLKKLVDARNQIAHGERIGVLSQDEWTEIKESAFFAMNALQLCLHEHLDSRGHLRAGGGNAGFTTASA